MRRFKLKALAAAIAVLFVVPQAAFGNGSNTRASDGKVLEPGAVFYPGDTFAPDGEYYLITDDEDTDYVSVLSGYPVTLGSEFSWSRPYHQWVLDYTIQSSSDYFLLGYGYATPEDHPSAIMCTGGVGTLLSPLTFELVTTMYRLYNPNSGEHFYTSNAAERDTLISVGWSNEGIGWYAPVHSDTPVYRLYNRNGGEHHYTTNAGERDTLVDLGWEDEGIGWYSDDSRRVPLYRQYNPNEFANNHNYTTSLEENNWLVSLGWQAEDIGWYGVGCSCC